MASQVVCLQYFVHKRHSRLRSQKPPHRCEGFLLLMLMLLLPRSAAFRERVAQYMPSMPPPWAAPWLASFFSGISETIASVVSIRPAIEAAFWSAVRVTFVGSMTPALTRSSNLSVAAL